MCRLMLSGVAGFNTSICSAAPIIILECCHFLMHPFMQALSSLLVVQSSAIVEGDLDMLHTYPLHVAKRYICG